MMIFFRKYPLIILSITQLTIFICSCDLLFAGNRTTSYRIDLLISDYPDIDEPSGELRIIFIHSDDTRVTQEMRKTLIPYLNVTLAAFRSDFAAYLDNRIRSLRSAKGEKNPDRETLRSIVEEINSRWNDLHEKITAEIKRKIDSTVRSLYRPSRDIPSHEKLRYAIRIKKISEVGIFSLTDSGSSGRPAKSLISNFIRDSRNISESIRATVLRLKTELPD